MRLGCAVKLPKIKWLSEIQGVICTLLRGLGMQHCP